MKDLDKFFGDKIPNDLDQLKDEIDGLKSQLHDINERLENLNEKLENTTGNVSIVLFFIVVIFIINQIIHFLKS